ncbi:MAG: UDP-N-acetylmuramate dehydrogenase [Nitrospirae bacterium]|nr:UDP-N-acetylmuramate dehydrogenase [Nitrospirota bacterium]
MSPAESVLRDAGFTGEARMSEPMSRHTSLRIGGPAEVMAYPEGVEELSRLLAAARKSGVAVFILGRGTNLLVLDGGIPGLTVNMKKLSWMDIERSGGGPAQVHAGAGASLTKLVSYCADAGLSGIEFAAGIPGTVGGAVAMNAGAGEGEIKDVLTSVTLVDGDGTVTKLPASALNMTYRRGGLPEASTVVEASMALIPWPAEEVKERVAANIRRRRATQPIKVMSAGSTFRNPPGYSAWKLIDMAGLRGKTVGGAAVCTAHTNFLVNTGNATARDFRALMDLVVNTVRERLNIELVPEVRIVGVEL